MAKQKTAGEILRDALLSGKKDDEQLATDLGAAFRRQMPGAPVTRVSVNGKAERRPRKE
jgi:hypothetical protein